MKKFKYLLISGIILGLLSWQRPVRAVEMTETETRNLSPTVRASNVSVAVTGQTAAINYGRSKSQVPYLIAHAVWSEENGQDNLKWYDMTQTATTEIDLSRHAGFGTFHVHTYIKIGERLIALNATSFRVDKPASKTAVTVTGSNGQIAFSRNKDQASAKISHAVWSDDKGSDDLKWYDAGQEVTDFSLAQHRGYGKYFVDTYENKNGKMIYQSGTTFQLDKSEPVMETSFPEPGIMDLRISQLPTTTYKVTVPTWSDQNGQDDLQWYTASQNPDGSYNLRIDLKKHHYHSGTYHLHLYGESHVQPEFTGLTGIRVQVDKDKLPSQEEMTPVFSVENINQEQGTYTVKVSETAKSKPVQSVKIPIWSTSNHSNIKWYEATNNGDGSFTAQFDIRNHQALSGSYNNHIYVKYKDQSEHSYATQAVSMSTEHIQPKTTVRKITSDKYEIQLTDAFGEGDIILPTWSEENGQDDLKWYTARKTGLGTYSWTVNAQEHAGSGRFNTHIYRRLNGQMIGMGGTHYQVDKPILEQTAHTSGQVHTPDYAAAYSYPKGQCTWGAKVLAPWAGNYWGNGGQWADSARKAGFQVGSTPRVGAIVCWTDGGYGHVAVVTHVQSNTRIQVKEANYAGKQYIGNFRGWFNPHDAGQGAVSYIYPK